MRCRGFLLQIARRKTCPSWRSDSLWNAPELENSSSYSTLETSGVCNHIKEKEAMINQCCSRVKELDFFVDLLIEYIVLSLPYEAAVTCILFWWLLFCRYFLYLSIIQQNITFIYLLLGNLLPIKTAKTRLSRRCAGNHRILNIFYNLMKIMINLFFKGDMERDITFFCIFFFEHFNERATYQPNKLK